MLRRISVLFLLFVTVSARAQIKFVNKLIDKVFSSDTNKYNSFMPVPVLGYTQEAGVEFGAAGLYSFYIDKEDSIIRPSQLFGIGYTSTKGQTQVSLRGDIWSRRNKWHHFYEARFYNFMFNFYGIGANTRFADQDLLKLVRFRLNAEVERKVTSWMYAGGGAEFESQRFYDDHESGYYALTDLNDKDGGYLFFVKATQLIDTRNTNTYTTNGFYTRLRYSYAPDVFDASSFTGSMLFADVRYFKSLGKPITFGGQLFHESLLSNYRIPFYTLRQMGNDQIMRGYYIGRFRDENYSALQLEVRYRFSPRFGIIAFGGTGAVYNAVLSTNMLKPNYGVGGRFFFDLDKSLSLRVDYGWGEKTPGEKRIGGLYISLGEAF